MAGTRFLPLRRPRARARARVEQVVSVLHARDIDDLPCLVEFVDGDLGQSDPADLALSLQVPQRACLVGERCFGVDAVQLKKLDPLDTQSAERLLDLLPQHGRPPVELPLARGARSSDANFGGDQEFIRVGVQGLGQEFLIGSPAIEMRGVDQRDTQLDGLRATVREVSRPRPGSVGKCMAPKPNRRTFRSPPIQNAVDVTRCLPPSLKQQR